MLSYLLNASLVWLVSLAVYEVFLKQETFHSWNRTYLLLTLILGFILPKVSWEESAESASTFIRLPLEQMRHMKAGVIKATHVTSTTVTPSIDWLMIIHLTGLSVAAFFLLRDLTRLINLRWNASLSKRSDFTLVETHQAHGPFSFFHCIYLSSTEDFSPEELQLIFAHEQRHIRLRHSLDTIVLSLIRLALWFHPLIWWYQKRLQMIHEFQADYNQRTDAVSYGRFLIEQQMLLYTPVFTHSFFHSPIKNRITMLTKNASSKTKLMKYLLVIPMAAVLLLACNQSSIKPSVKEVKENNKIIFRGNEFEMNTTAPQKIMMVDPSGRRHEETFTVDAFPVKMNGEQVYRVDSMGPEPKLIGAHVNLAAYLYSKEKDEINKLHDGSYHITTSYLVVDKKGKLVYFGDAHLFPYMNRSLNNLVHDGIIDLRLATTKDDGHTFDSTLIKQIDASLQKELKKADLSYQPAVFNGSPVITRGTDHCFDFCVVIKNHQSTFEPIPERLGVSFLQP